MPNAIEAFFSAWSMTDADERAAMIESAMKGSATYADPRSEGILEGVDAISNYVAAFSANAPGWTANVVKEDTTAAMVRATVAFGGMGPDGTQMEQLGQYFVVMEGDKITSMTGFVGTGAPDQGGADG